MIKIIAMSACGHERLYDQMREFVALATNGHPEELVPTDGLQAKKIAGTGFEPATSGL